jgi:hypothetical protein
MGSDTASRKPETRAPQNQKDHWKIWTSGGVLDLKFEMAIRDCGAANFKIYATGGKMRMRWGVADSPLETTGGFGHCLIERSLMQV